MRYPFRGRVPILLAFLGILSALFVSAGPGASEDRWLTDLEEATWKAQAVGKPILAAFR